MKEDKSTPLENFTSIKIENIFININEKLLN